MFIPGRAHADMAEHVLSLAGLRETAINSVPRLPAQTAAKFPSAEQVTQCRSLRTPPHDAWRTSLGS